MGEGGEPRMFSIDAVERRTASEMCVQNREEKPTRSHGKKTARRIAPVALRQEDLFIPAASVREVVGAVSIERPPNQY